ncbi:MAG: prepilin-type N-terminal cleavage/methylation domain-containing protein [Candidatus Moranbacteria bacterium]|nr:prepilin-type N-terminal cleavage/methylation domain-containing protein [Candidatus Moranbacteria bacterium]
MSKVKCQILHKQGFTLIELLLVIALVLIVSVPTAAFSTHFIYQMSVRDASEGLVGMLQEAQALSMLGKENSAWGVKKQSGKLILFRGEDFSNRDQAFDQALSINSHVNMIGFDEMSFSRYGGFPLQPTGSIVVAWGNVNEIFKLNSEGVFE